MFPQLDEVREPLVGPDGSLPDLLRAIAGRRTWNGWQQHIEISGSKSHQLYFDTSDRLDQEEDAELGEIGFWEYLNLYKEKADP